MTKYNEWEFEEEKPIYHSFKKKLDKNRFCKKNKLGNKKYGPHIYNVNGKTCDNCGHMKKEKKDNYELE